MSVKKIKHCLHKEDYVWNPSICACECDKDCDIDEYLKDCAFIKSLDDNLLITCDEIVLQSILMTKQAVGLLLLYY